MGNFYVNITLKGPEQKQVADYLDQRSRNAFISPTVDGHTIVFDQDCDTQDDMIITALTRDLSAQFHCPALAVLNHDDDILWYKLYDDGKFLDEYDSTPDYFDSSRPSQPGGGDATVLCKAFEVPDATAEVDKVLRTPDLPDETYLFAMDRHQDLAQALGLPSFVVAVGYEYLYRGEMPEGLTQENLIRVGSTQPSQPFAPPGDARPIRVLPLPFGRTARWLEYVGWFSIVLMILGGLLARPRERPTPAPNLQRLGCVLLALGATIFLVLCAVWYSLHRGF